MTNYERIHAMNPVQLAKFLDDLEANGPEWDEITICNGCTTHDCKNCVPVVRWLDTEVAE